VFHLQNREAKCNINLLNYISLDDPSSLFKILDTSKLKEDKKKKKKKKKGLNNHLRNCHIGYYLFKIFKLENRYIKTIIQRGKAQKTHEIYIYKRNAI
jgi:hypothetical protein